MTKRGLTGVSYRYTPEGLVNTLFGQNIPKIRCKVCKELKNQNEFYHRNVKNKKVPFKMCVKCDDQRRLLDAKILRRKNKNIFVDRYLKEKANLEKNMK